MKALIDADIFQWEFGSATDSEYKPLSWPLVQARVQGRIDGILEATECDSYQLYLTSDDKSNFRYNIATIRPYKGNRPTEKPHWYYPIRNFLIDHRGAQEVSGMEADDAISIDQYKDWILLRGSKDNEEQHSRVCKTVICSRDKDLNMIPGWHYSWPCGQQKEKKLWWQNEFSGLQSFYNQLLTGDTVDNIPGLYGVGSSSALCKHTWSCSTELECYELVHTEYVKRFGSYADQFLLENARLLWLLRYEGEEWNPPKVKE